MAAIPAPLSVRTLSVAMIRRTIMEKGRGCDVTTHTPPFRPEIIWRTVGRLMAEELSHTLARPRGSRIQGKRVRPLTRGDERPLLTDIEYL